MTKYDRCVRYSREYLNGLLSHDEFHGAITLEIAAAPNYAEWTWLAVAIDGYAKLIEGGQSAKP